jgi:hypothetical protein
MALLERYPFVAELLNKLSNELYASAEQLEQGCTGAGAPAPPYQSTFIDTSARLVATMISMQAPPDDAELIQSLHRATIALLEAWRLIAAAAEQVCTIEMPPGFVSFNEQARLIVRGAQALQHGIGLLTGERRLGVLEHIGDTIGQIEIAADVNKRQAVARLLRSGLPIPQRQALRTLYETLEDITDRYEDAIDALLDVASLEE